MGRRPRIKPELTATDKVIETLGWLLVVMMWVYTAASYLGLPDMIPSHYDSTGSIDTYGTKSTILYLPLVVTVIFGSMTILNNYPHIFNYPVGITEENALRQYTIATRMMRYLKLIIALIFGLILFKTIRDAEGNGLGSWFLPVMLGLLLIPLIYFLAFAFKKNKNFRKGD